MCHIFIMPTTCNGLPITISHTHLANPCEYTHASMSQGVDHTQAICRAVHNSLAAAITIPYTHTYLWLWPHSVIPMLTNLAPHRNAHLTYNTCALVTDYLAADLSQFLYV